MASIPASQNRRRPPSRSTARQRALVVGVSGYPAPIPKLPAVAADVRAMARVLESKNGVFHSAGIKVLTEKLATGDQVLAELRQVFAGAKAGDTVFVYLAGHGEVEDVRFRGRRKSRYSNGEPHEILVEGTCSLSVS